MRRPDVKQIRVLFDECLSKPAMEQLAVTLRGQESNAGFEIEFKHVLEFQKQGVADADWIPQRAAEGWLLITADRGKGHKGIKRQILPMLCEKHGLTCAMLSKRLHHCRTEEKFQVLVKLWPRLTQLVDAPRGLLFRLELTAQGKARVVRISKK